MRKIGLWGLKRQNYTFLGPAIYLKSLDKSHILVMPKHWEDKNLYGGKFLELYIDLFGCVFNIEENLKSFG